MTGSQDPEVTDDYSYTGSRFLNSYPIDLCVICII